MKEYTPAPARLVVRRNGQLYALSCGHEIWVATNAARPLTQLRCEQCRNEKRAAGSERAA